MPLPNELPKMSFEGVDPAFQKWLDQVADTINSHSGYNGPVKFADHLDMGGKRVTNIGAPVAVTDAISHSFAEKKYSAAALKPQLQAGSSQPLDTYRQINNQNQREVVSSWLNDLMSTPPSANAIIPLTTPSMGGISVTIPASPFTFADKSTVMLESRTDLLTLPISYAISAISCIANLVTVQTTLPITLTVGQGVTITGVSPSGFNGSFTVTSYTAPNIFTYQDDLGTVSGSGGNVELLNVYYYLVRKRSTKVSLIGPVSGDTAQNRLNANFDASQIVAVVVLTNSGSQVASSGGGGSAIVGSPTAGVFF
jgi:hypothetical protein